MKKMDLPQGTTFDYRLGYVKSGTALPGFDVFGNMDNLELMQTIKKSTCTRIVTLGSCEGWAGELSELLGKEVQILDGSTDGYTSAQAMIMLLRDGLIFKPEKVICVCGYYDFAYHLGIDVNEYDAEILKNHPFATPTHISYYTTITERLGLGHKGIYYGEPNNKPANEIWLDHAVIMNALCEEFDIDFYTFLQPNKNVDNPQLCNYYATVERYADRYKFIYSLPQTTDTKQVAESIKEQIWNS